MKKNLMKLTALALASAMMIPSLAFTANAKEETRAVAAYSRQFIWDQNHPYFYNIPYHYVGLTFQSASYTYNPYSGLKIVIVTYA